MMEVAKEWASFSSLLRVARLDSQKKMGKDKVYGLKQKRAFYYPGNRSYDDC